MVRPTLKLGKPLDPAAVPKAPSARARRAQQGRKLPRPPPVPVPLAPTGQGSGPAPTPAAATPQGSRTAGEKSRLRRGKPPKTGERRSPPDGTRSTPASAKRGPGPRAKPVASAVAPFPAAKRAPPAASAATARRDPPEHPRLSKRMSELGLCSRREADEWIENGWVRVDGVVIDRLGTRVPPHAPIEIDPAAARHQSEQVTILLNKPLGYVSGLPEDGHEPAMVLIKPENRWADDPSRAPFRPGHLRGLAPAGRLDIDSTGLIVFTQDGRIAKLLVGRDSAIEKEYLVRVEGTLRPGGLELLQHGLELDGVKLKPARVSWQNEDQLRFVLREGRKRQIRRMCELVGLAVTGLKRVRCGSVSLGPLPVGQWRYLRRDEKF